MKKIVTIILVLFVYNITTAQFCQDFNDENIKNWKGVKNKPNEIDSPGPSGEYGDLFLHAYDGAGYSYIYNEVDFKGDWTTVDGQCLCWDFQILNDAGYNKPLSPKMTIYSDDGKEAYFTATVTVSQGDGWVHICAPVNACEGEVLPSNPNGYWSMKDGYTCQDWNDLLRNVKGVKFVLDITSSPTEEYGYDNICIQDCNIKGEPTDDGAFCCDGDNLVTNGNFEYGNKGFMSDYDNNTSLYPGSYNVTNTAAVFGTEIKDHSYCIDPEGFYSNQNFLLINGKTTQTVGTSSVIWEQTISVEEGKDYKFCANFKHLPQCRFDIVPEVSLEINGVLEPWRKVKTSKEVCDWLNLSGCFRGNEKGIATVKIHLKEDGLGDGNDLAIDDISVQEKLSQNLSITVHHQGTSKEVVGSLNTISTVDDRLLVEKFCERENRDDYFWYVFEVKSYPFTDLASSMVPGTFAWSSNLGGYSQAGGALPSAWNLTTKFPGYNFDNNKLYFIGLYVPSCCKSCYTNGCTYQLILNHGLTARNANVTVDLCKQVENDIVKMFIPYIPGLDKPIDPETPEVLENNDTKKELEAYPNPASNTLNLSQEVSSYEITDASGRVLKTNKKATSSIDIASLNRGIYILSVTTATNKRREIKFIKE